MASIDSDTQEEEEVLLDTAMKGNLRGFKRAAYKLAKNKGLAEAIASACDKNGNGALHFAAAGGRTAICRYLIDDLKFDPNLSSLTGKTAIAYAASTGCVQTIEYLIAKGAHIDARASDGFTAVDNAILDGQHGALRVLVSSGAPVDAEYITGGPLLLAAHFDDVPCMKILLDYNANPNLSCVFISPLVVSVTNNSRECVKILIKAGAELNNISLLEWAIDSKKMMLYLLKKGASPDITNELGRFPIETAALKGKKEIVDILFPLTSPFKGPVEWSIKGLFSYVESDEYNEEEEVLSKRRIKSLKTEIKHALNRKETFGPSIISDFALKVDPFDVISDGIRSLCWNRFSSALTATSSIGSILDQSDSCSNDDIFSFSDDEYDAALLTLIDGQISEPEVQNILTKLLKPPE